MKTWSSDGPGRARGRAEMVVFDRHGPPAEERLSLLGDDAREELLQIGGARWDRSGRRRRPRRSAPAPADRSPSAAADLAQKAIRHLDQNAGAVARVGFAAARAAVLEVDQHLEPARDDRMRLAAGDVDDESDAAGVVLEGRVVQPGPLQGVNVLRRTRGLLSQTCRH